MMSVDTTVDDYLLTRVSVETPKPSSQHVADTSSSSISTTKNASTYIIYPN